jgi:hypothetical protein
MTTAHASNPDRRTLHGASAQPRAAPLLKLLFFVVAGLVLAAAGYAGWIVIRTWGDVGV